MIPNYDRAAKWYDGLASLVFGTRLEDAKITHLNNVRSGDHVLIVGGGSGRLLAYLDELGIACHVDFVEVSHRMMQSARKKSLSKITVDYYQKDILLHTSNKKYDVVITNFFFDQYNEAACHNYLRHFMAFLREGGLLLYADFIPPEGRSDKILKDLMYSFFRLTIGLGKVQLIDHRIIFRKAGLLLEKSAMISSFIVSEVYRIV